ncbi:hypothetical protein ACHAXT_002647 [Thalassiosira profunda]
MSEPPPQYILPSAAPPLAPARPSAPHSGGGRRVVGPVREGGRPNIARTGAASAAAPPAVRASEARSGDGAAENKGAGENARPAAMAAPSATGEVDPTDVHIGPTGNPVGSIGYLASGALDGEGPALDLRAEGEEKDGVVDAAATKPLRTDDASDAVDAAHFPLEISTEGGGVSAVLPSGRVLVERTGPLTSKTAEDASDKAAANTHDCVASGLERAASDNVGADEGAEARYSQTPPEAGSPASDVREAPLLESHALHPRNLQSDNTPHAPVPLSGSSDEEEGRSSPASLPHAGTASSSLSEDPTFNSYAQSDLSSMLSHLEIQALLQQGRQQQRDMGAADGMPPPPLPETIGGGKGRRATPTMVLYASQSLHASGNMERAASIAPPPSLPSNPSLSSHNLHLAAPLGGRDSPDDGDEEAFRELRNAAPLSTMPTTASEEETVTVEVEVGADDQTSTHSVETYRTASTGGLVASDDHGPLLGTSSKSLADDLVEGEDDEEAGAGERATGREEGAQKTTSSAAIFDDRPTSPSSNGGYSADLSNLILEAHAIEECSTTTSYHGLDLSKALPTADDEEDSRRQDVGYGHTYDREPLPPMKYAKPVVPAAFPSLMDASVSSAWTASTAPSMTSRSVGAARNGEGEEREDSLRPTSAQDPPAVPPVGAAPGDPLAATADGEVAPFAPPAATAGGGLDPRLNVDYERRYIVDLERINEESSGGLEVGSYGRKASGGDGRASSASSLRETEPGPNAVPSGGAAAAGEYPAHGPPLPPPPATTNPPTEFYDYRHQYYTEQLHYFDGPGFSKGAGGDDNGDDETDSTCSSVTLSQAFHPDDGAASIASSLTEDDHSASRGSTVSSVTLSRALSADRHDHAGGGFYVATRLGDYVEVPKDPEGSPVSDDGEDVSVLPDPFDGGSVAGTAGTGLESDGDAPTADTAAGLDVVSDAAAAESKGAGPMAPGRHAGDDLLAALVPECGVPIPSVMATVGATSSGRRSGKGGYLLPWHSARSIGNYQHGRRGKKKGAQSQSSRHASLLSTSSVHTFRG